MIGTFEANNINKFMEDFLYGRTTLYNVSLSDGDFLKKKCEDIQEQKTEIGIDLNKFRWWSYFKRNHWIREIEKRKIWKRKRWSNEKKENNKKEKY